MLLQCHSVTNSAPSACLASIATYAVRVSSSIASSNFKHVRLTCFTVASQRSGSSSEFTVKRVVNHCALTTVAAAQALGGTDLSTIAIQALGHVNSSQIISSPKTLGRPTHERNITHCISRQVKRKETDNMNDQSRRVPIGLHEKKEVGANAVAGYLKNSFLRRHIHSAFVFGTIPCGSWRSQAFSLCQARQSSVSKPLASTASCCPV